MESKKVGKSSINSMVPLGEQFGSKNVIPTNFVVSPEEVEV
jgi:hypothetical protein